MNLNTSTDPQVGYRPPGALGASPLGRYEGHFGRRQAAHLLRRMGFGGTAAEVERLAALGGEDAVDSLMHPQGSDVDLPDYPDSGELYDVHLSIRNQSAQMWWLNRMLATRRPFVEKMALFWHGHFATSLVGSKVSAAHIVRQIRLFQTTGLGNFRTLLHAITYDPAMLVWLDNRKNVASHPNENYARELMELFTLGLENYSEDDVKSAARALTGITLQPGDQVVFKPALHDFGVKTFLGKTGAFGADDIVDIILEQPIHQRFLARKLLEFFVYSDPEPELTEALAQVYAVSGFDIARTVGTIVRSNAFFSPRAYRALPKSPIEFVIGVQRFMQFPSVPLDTLTWLGRMGQVPLSPLTVKGWDGGPTWINTTTMLARMNYVNEVVHAQPARSTQGVEAKGPVQDAARLPGMPKFPSQLPSMLDPDAIIAAAGGLDAEKVLDAVVRGTVEDDVTGDLRATLRAYLDGAGSDNPQPFGPETYAIRTRGLLGLALTLPANNLN